MTRAVSDRYSFFRELESGTPFRFESTHKVGDEIRRNWIYCRFDSIHESGTVKLSYWDLRYEFVIDWKKRDIPKVLEVFDPTLTPEQLATPIYLESSRKEYVQSSWVLGELEGSSWINQYTHSIVDGGSVDLDRWGRPQLFYTGRDGYRRADVLSIWRSLDQVRLLVIRNWDRYDTMAHEEKVERAAQRVSHCAQETRATRFNGRPRPGAQKDLAKAKQLYRDLSGHTVISPDVLNAGIKTGEQLGLF